ncbi:AAA family ATPase [Streptococcus anginosus]|uniref:AAA family ATPase n=1 Tax=Streptococcus anginosus TaxID=1328 RepID=UPI00195BCCCC|nr:AAA family ATPase [Streptococcus anginosus]VTY30497.1 DNA replication and repair protein RecF [Streptococcus anginosus]
MYIETMKVIKLHKVYNYDIKFNQDITILYGENGSGKTTILSILESLLTARVWELFEIDFEQIILQSDKEFSIRVFRKIDKESGLYLEIEILHDELSKSDKIFQNTINSLDISTSDVQIDFNAISSVYPIITDIKTVFNELYLPINRIPSTIREGQIHMNSYRRNNLSDNTNIDSSLKYAMNLIERENRIIESRKNRYNQEFKNQILSSSLGINIDNLSNILTSEEIIDPDKIRELKIKYIKMLDDLAVPNEDKDKIESFLDNYQQKLPDVLNFLSSKEKDSSNQEFFDLITFFFEASEIVRMTKILPIAEKLEKRLSDISNKIRNFTGIVNSFFQDSMEQKELFFDNFGIPYFKIKGRSEKIQLKHLSSGEKQIVILFANLVLTNRYQRSKMFRNVFIADEPEISLHMLWQLKLIPNILKSRKNLQIILATHSPEVVGEFENKMFELKKERADNE